MERITPHEYGSHVLQCKHVTADVKCLHTDPVLASKCPEGAAVQLDSKLVATFEHVVTVFIHEVEFSVHETPGQLCDSENATYAFGPHFPAQCSLPSEQSWQ